MFSFTPPDQGYSVYGGQQQNANQTCGGSGDGLDININQLNESIMQIVQAISALDELLLAVY